MSDLWQKFVRSFGDEVGGVALLIAAGSVIGALALFVHWLSVGKFIAAFSLASVLGLLAGACVRDYRRRRWSILSRILIGVWILVTLGAAAIAVWFEFRIN